MTQNGHFSARSVIKSDGHLGEGGGVQPQKTQTQNGNQNPNNPKWDFMGVLGFLGLNPPRPPHLYSRKGGLLGDSEHCTEYIYHTCMYIY